MSPPGAGLRGTAPISSNAFAHAATVGETARWSSTSLFTSANVIMAFVGSDKPLDDRGEQVRLGRDVRRILQARILGAVDVAIGRSVSQTTIGDSISPDSVVRSTVAKHDVHHFQDSVLYSVIGVRS